jgi:Membrane proteins related to metalloendopeptidases
LILVLKSKKLFMFLFILLFCCFIFTFCMIKTSSAKVKSQKLEENNYIKWVDFNITYDAMNTALKLDIDSHNKETAIRYNWIEILAYLGTKYGGTFKKYKNKDIDDLIKKLDSGASIESITKNMKYYSYYFEVYNAILGEFVGSYEIQVSDTDDSSLEFVEKYGLKVFSPIAKGYYYSHFDDFGQNRSYGYKRKHLGHDLMGSIGTPIIAIESGTIEELGWNQYGGWRIGIRSFDKKRYYYYAHLRKDYPYNKALSIGNSVNAGDVIGYLGRTGYSAIENTNNINDNHLHFGIQLIFDESQKEGSNEIWIDCYAITKLLEKNKSKVIKIEGTKEYKRVYDFIDNPNRKGP